MGFRFYKRINFGDGFGINLGKRGASWSVRTKGGSFGSKGYSVRTPIKGLSYQKRFRKSSSRHSSYNNYSTGIESTTNNTGLVLGVGIIIFLCIFSTTILYIVITFFVLIILYSIFSLLTNNKKPNQTIDTTIETLNQTSSTIVHKSIQPKTLSSTSAIKVDNTINVIKPDIGIEKLLNHSQLLTLENICIDIDNFIDEITYEKKSNPAILQQYSIDEIKQLILHDICNLFHLLQTSLNDNSIEKEIWFSIVFYFSAKSTSYTTYDEHIIRKKIQKLVAPDFFVYSNIDKNPFTALMFLKEQDRPLYLKYKRLLNDYVTLISTIDFDLTINERKLIQIMNRQ